jgi:competence protein ComEC
MNWRQYRKTLHVSWHIAVVSAGGVIGVAIAPFADARIFSHFVWLIVGFCLVVFVFYKRFIWLIPLTILGGVVLGIWRGATECEGRIAYKAAYGHEIVMAGMLAEDGEKDGAHSMILKVAASMMNGNKTAGKVWVSTDSANALKRGDSVMISGKIDPGFGSYSGVVYRGRIVKTEQTSKGDVAGRLSEWFALRIRRTIHEPEASLGIGYLIGQRNALPDDLDTVFVTAGLTHIIVASGYNLTILVRFTRRLFMRVSKFFSTFTAFAMVGGFMAITGVSPSMSRAGLVTGLSLLAWYYGRKFHPLVLLPFAAVLTVFIVPTYAWGDVGWLLSFAAFGGVMIFAPLMQEYFFGTKKPGTMRQIAGETIAAQIATLPVLLFIFGQMSNVAVFANMLILPFIPLTMVLVFIAGIGAGLGGWVGLPAELLLRYMISIAHYFADLPWAQTLVPISFGICAGIYAAIVFACIFMWRKTRLNLQTTSVVE